MNRKFILTSAVVVILIIAGWLWSSQSGKQKELYLTEPVKKGNITTTVIATGTVRSNNRVEVGAQVSGEITELAVKLGDHVKKDQLIARIDSTTKENAFKQAESQLATYQAEYESKKIALDVAQRNFNRMNSLVKTNAVSRESVDTASDTLASAKAALRQVEENIRQADISVSSAKTDLNYTTILSPIDGVIISVPVSVGQTVNSAMSTPTIVQIADLNTMLVKLEIPEGDVTKIQSGMTATFTTLADPDIQYKEPVKSVDPGLTTLADNSYTESVTSTDAVYYYANVVVPNPEGKLRIGMSAEGAVNIAERENVLVVPTLAIKRHNGKTMVSVLDGEQKTEREVTTGIRNEYLTEVSSGLKEGDKVIIAEMSTKDARDTSMPGPMGGPRG